jgi:hypothetical protein
MQLLGVNQCKEPPNTTLQGTWEQKRSLVLVHYSAHCNYGIYSLSTACHRDNIPSRSCNPRSPQRDYDG